MAPEIWIPGAPSHQGAYWYYRPDDEVTVKTVIGNQQGISVPRTIRVKPNGETHLGLVHAYLVASDGCDEGWIARTDFGEYDFPTRYILELCVDLIGGLRELSSERICGSSVALRHFIAHLDPANTTQTHMELGRLADILFRLAGECIAPLEHGSPFSHNASLDANKSWWEHPPSLVNDLRSVKRELKHAWPSGPCHAVVEIHNWLDSMVDRVGRFQRRPGGRITDHALTEASAYCAALAERYLLRGNRALAVLMLHRSVDYCLLNISANNKLIDWSAYGGRYDLARIGGSESAITLLRSLEVLNSMALISPKADRTSAFEDLNSWRNQLIQTHHLSDLSDRAARDMFSRVRPHLEAIANKDWRPARDSYLSGIQVNLASFLDVGGVLRSTFDITTLIP